MSAAEMLDRIFAAAAAAKAAANARDVELVRQDQMCVHVAIPLKFRVSDIAEAERRLLAADPKIKKVASGSVRGGAHQRVVEPYQSLILDGPNYAPRRE